MIGKYVSVRTYSAGVHVGELAEHKGNEVVLKDSRRVYYWKCKKGISLSEVASLGIDQERSKICSTIPVIHIIGVIEIIPLSKDAKESIYNAKPHRV